MGSYSFFNQGVDIFSANAFEVPTTLPAGSLHDLLTIFLDATQRQGRHPQRRQRHGRVVDDRQSRRAGHRGQLSMTRLTPPDTIEPRLSKAGLERFGGVEGARDQSIGRSRPDSTS